MLIGCGTDTGQGTSDNPNNVELTKISTQRKDTDQQLANKAKDILKKKESVSGVNAVNTSKKLVIAVDVPQHERFKMAETRKKLRKEMKKKFSQVDVELSTDQKIILELEKLEEKLQKGSIKKKDLEKQVEDIIKLSKEQT
ncbi:Sporulation lipoprotein YhcN/YlaJ (Spore_YhcN_YlaJ) [Oceanobacillus limi]|uniref:Sporulation lipoprotein YhcN/YlaJ (Spore_YhcN_YlaJ) n=1 Tax=Oceanobacillus limi TaxID=930131 RepID=A0A1I0D8N1_9BACI|nr:Sporulation lipoprotein YhcN/YlaJ (Spore_YhcN_YlaJ) [Oceanobacillus limi]